MDLRITTTISATNPIENDLFLEEGTVATVDGIDAIAQQLKIKARFYLGTWFLNENEGMPYFEFLLVKGPDKQIIRDIFREMCTKTPGVKEFRKFDMTNTASRAWKISIEVLTDTGLVLALDFDRAFVIQQPER